MKNIIAISMILIAVALQGQTKTEKISKELSFEKKGAHNALVVANINGSITVEGHNGSTILVEVEKIITGKTDSRLEMGMQEIRLGIMDRADTIILYVDGICPPFGRDHRGYKSHSVGWNYNWDNCDNKNPDYDYKLNFKIKLPAAVNLMVSTINNGNVSVGKVSGHVNANNINGGIRLADLQKAARAHTINGDVDIDYLQNPDSDCRFYTLNGNIHANFKKHLSSEVSFKTYNGEFFTNLDGLVALPVEVEKLPSKKGTKYKVNGNRYKAGEGGPHLDFETFNGNVYLKEQ